MPHDLEKKVVTRFPPSPTGFLHIGSVRTALFNFLYAKKMRGDIVFRLEDTDTLRYKREFEESIITGLSWLGLSFKNPTPLKQSERVDRYRFFLKKLVDAGHAYVSKEEARENGRDEVIRFKNSNGKVTFTDLIRGEITFDTTDLGDFVIAKSLEEPLYHMAVVVDDFDMEVTHVIRGEDHISNTPRQILILEALGFPRPHYAHIPLILAPDRSKMSKRHGATSIETYRDMGYLPEAIINFLALLGWNPGTDKEIFSLPELVENFDLAHVQKGGAIFNIEKLKWFNKHYMHALSHEQKITHLKNIAHTITDKDVLARFVERLGLLREKPDVLFVISERTSTFGEVRDAVIGEFDYLFAKPMISDPHKLMWKGETDKSKTIELLHKTSLFIAEINEQGFTKEAIKNTLWTFAEGVGRGNVLWPFRMALSGKDKSPDPFVLAEILGKNETLDRIAEAKNLLS